METRKHAFFISKKKATEFIFLFHEIIFFSKLFFLLRNTFSFEPQIICVLKEFMLVNKLFQEF